MLLQVKDLAVKVGEKLVVRSASLTVNDGEVVYLLGPNASGKTTLIRAIMGFPNYRVIRGKLMYEGRDVTNVSLEQRVRLGLGMTYQIPPKIDGIKVRELLKELLRRRSAVSEYEEIISTLNIEYLIDRDLNRGFSGGEMKRVEVALLAAQAPRLALVDEPDSGVDVESIMYIAEGLKKLLNKRLTKSMVIVTHTAFITKYLKPSKVCIMKDGVVRGCGGADLIDEIMKEGFKPW
ncbi:MAG: ATP-binding cassette domain-containing protein [Desulfurococcales archaeon]|nr:ATP-binding cassette domain-containing protein [Desulfurococcales archaeon]